jgi:hypothetical protein
VRRDLLEAGCGQRLQSAHFRFGAPLEVDRLAFRQGDEFVLIAGPDVDIGVAEEGAGEIESVAGQAACVAPPGAVAVGGDGVELEDRLQRRIDDAQMIGRVLRRFRQLGSEFGEGAGDDRRFPGREWRQAEQPADDRRIAGDLERTRFAFAEIDIPRRLQRDDQRRRGFGDQLRTLLAARVDPPADPGRAWTAFSQGQAVAVIRVEPPAAHQTLERRRAVARPETEGAQSAGFMQAIAPQGAEDAEILFVDELRPTDQRAFDVPPLLGAVGKLALDDGDSEMALVRRPFQQVEELLAAAGGPRLLLRHGDRRTAQILDP